MDEIKMIMNDDGVFKEYDDAYDITIHCTSENEQKSVIEKLHSRTWIPVKERLPASDNFVLMSFANFSLPMIGRYEQDENGGAWYLGDCDGQDTCVANDLFVNAWMPLPKQYKGE